MLLEDSLNINAVDETRKIALVLATEKRLEKAVEFLIDISTRNDPHYRRGRAIRILVTQKHWHRVGTAIARKRKLSLWSMSLHTKQTK